MAAATGQISKAEDHAAITLADCDTWRSWVGAADRTQALSRIHTDALPRDKYTVDELQTLRPFCILWTEEEESGFTIVRTATVGWAGSGRIWLYFQADTPEQMEKSPGDIGRWFKNKLGDIVDELIALTYQEFYLAIRSIAFSGPFRSDPKQYDSMGDYMEGLLALDWGAAR
jgi:hypothetical protein